MSAILFGLCSWVVGWMCSCKFVLVVGCFGDFCWVVLAWIGCVSCSCWVLIICCFMCLDYCALVIMVI